MGIMDYMANDRSCEIEYKSLTAQEYHKPCSPERPRFSEGLESSFPAVFDSHRPSGPPVLDNFINNLAKAIGFNEYVPITESLKRKILGYGDSAEQPMFFRVLNALERGARKYKAKNGTPPVLILDNISELGKENRGSGATHDDAKLGIEEKVANQLIQLLGGRIRDLKTYGDMINVGETFEEVRKIVLGAVNQNFHQAQMMEGEDNHVIGKVIIQELVKNNKIHFDAFIKLVNNKRIADELLQANVFSYNPESRIVTFQSRATEVFVRESPEFSLK
ncbi:P-loop containing nucleoside triphosphate hydrolase protein [Rhizophagus clarus]|uniref:P-loop containing nucleoside triphosphate hydrolase protein n=1 Tax=Rhizophagus clarus TaxID=94130 RepID=A0A8H3LZL5_9GLOM|nr:P-loop containing nucleoside triphosphate hydrolase protein [Rhizophagus clarus]